MQELTSAEHQAYALQDVEDVKAADVLVFWTDPTKAIVRGGRHAEFGMAVILGIPILVVGKEHENIFHYLSDVTHFETWYDVREKLYETYVQKTANESL
jgi:nucleoside 2-deoxyribosyltransferase